MITQQVNSPNASIPVTTASVSIVFIDSGVEHLESLVNGVVKDAQVVALDSKRDGVEQITEVLTGRDEVGTVHIVSHGAPGCLYLGNNQLSLDNLEAYAAQLQTWFTTPASLFLYGCNVAAGDAGAEFIQKLHQLTGAEIAASAQRTGSTLQGGDWKLEIRTGDFVPSLAFLPQVMETYAGVFSEPNDTLAQATSTGINGLGTFSTSGSIGDNPNISNGDVDLYQVQLNAGNFITADIDAEVIGSDLDSYLRLFDSSGNELADNDDANGSDSLLGFTVPTTGTYYIGVSSFGNRSYNPSVADSGTSGDTTGNYNLTITSTSFNPFSAILATAPGDGGVRVALDPYGSFGSTTGEAIEDPEFGEFSDDAFYDPLGSQGESGTVYASAVAIRFGNTGSRQYLSFYDIGDADGLTGATYTAVSPTSAQSTFAYNGLNFVLDQRVSDILDANSLRQGSQLVQTYTITNPGSTVVDFELIRYVDGDLDFDGSLKDTGGVTTIDGKTTLFETDGGGSATDRTIFVGITDAGGTPLPGYYDIEEFDTLRSRIENGESLNNAIVGDTDGDKFIDAAPYDIEIALGRGFTLNPGQSVTYTTATIFGEPSPAEISTNIAPLAKNDTATTNVNTPVTINVLANDSDADGGSLSFSIGTNPTNGAAVVNNNGTPGNLTDDFVTYTPNAGFSGTDSFTYQLSDGQGGTTTGVVGVTVEAPPQPTVNITATDATAAETGGDTGTYRISRNNSNGSLSVQLALSGNASASDYSLSNNLSVSGSTATVVFANGQSFVDVVLNPVNDTIAELDETLTLSLNSNAAYILGSNTNATVTIAASDQILGTSGNDRLVGTKTDNIISGLDGNDTISGLEGNDYLDGGNGNDSLFGDDGNDSLFGGNGTDSLFGGNGNDSLFGGLGDDSLKGSNGNDSLEGGDGNDSLEGGNDNDSLLGGIGNDSLNGGSGSDRILGGTGNDILLGDAGSDTLLGGAGNDTLTGGTGIDIFALALGEGTDIIRDFTLGQGDKIGLAGGLTFEQLSLSGNQIFVGSEVLATLTNINTSTLTSANFVSV